MFEQEAIKNDMGLEISLAREECALLKVNVTEFDENKRILK